MRASRTRTIRKTLGIRKPGRKHGGKSIATADYIEYIDEDGKRKRMTKEALRIQEAMAEERRKKDEKNRRVREARARAKAEAKA